MVAEWMHIYETWIIMNDYPCWVVRIMYCTWVCDTANGFWIISEKYSRTMFSPIFCIHDSEITFWSNFELASQKLYKKKSTRFSSKTFYYCLRSSLFAYTTTIRCRCDIMERCSLLIFHISIKIHYHYFLFPLCVHNIIKN